MKKMLSFLCASVICLSGSSMYAYAEGNDSPADDPVIQEYVYTYSISSDLSIESSGSATGTSIVNGDSSLVTKIVVHQYLQKQNGSDWDTIDSWNNTTYTWRNSCNFPYTVTSAGTYRIRTVADVYHNSSYETVDCNSNSVAYP